MVKNFENYFDDYSESDWSEDEDEFDDFPTFIEVSRNTNNQQEEEEEEEGYVGMVVEIEQNKKENITLIKKLSYY